MANYFGDTPTDPSVSKPQLREFMRLCERGATIEVNCDWIEQKTLFDLTNCVVKSYSLPQDLEEKNVQRFSMTLESDNLIDID